MHRSGAVPERSGRRVRDVVVGATILRPGKDGLDAPGDPERERGLMRVRDTASEEPNRNGCDPPHLGIKRLQG